MNTSGGGAMTAHIENFGIIVATQGIRKDVPTELLERVVERYINKDWGELPQDEKEMNDEIVNKANGSGRILANYKDACNGKDIWIMTYGYGLKKEDIPEGAEYTLNDCCNTTVLFPEEY